MPASVTEIACRCHGDYVTVTRMCNATLTAAFETPLPPTEKLVLVCLADMRNGANGRCNPSISTICRRTGLCRRSVNSAIATLRDRNIIVTMQTGRSLLYGFRIGPERKGPMCSTYPSDVQEMHIRGAGDAPKPEVTQMNPVGAPPIRASGAPPGVFATILEDLKP